MLEVEGKGKRKKRGHFHGTVCTGVFLYLRSSFAFEAALERWLSQGQGVGGGVECDRSSLYLRKCRFFGRGGCLATQLHGKEDCRCLPRKSMKNQDRVTCTCIVLLFLKERDEFQDVHRGSQGDSNSNSTECRDSG